MIVLNSGIGGGGGKLDACGPYDTCPWMFFPCPPDYTPCDECGSNSGCSSNGGCSLDDFNPCGPQCTINV